MNQAAHTFTTKTGTKFEVGAMSSWTAPNGNLVHSARVNTFDPKSGHGWSGIMSAAEIDIWRSR